MYDLVFVFFFYRFFAILFFFFFIFVFFQAEDGIRDLVRSRGLGDVYKRQRSVSRKNWQHQITVVGCCKLLNSFTCIDDGLGVCSRGCLLYTSDAADERSSVDLGGRRIIKKNKDKKRRQWSMSGKNTTHISAYKK